MDLPAAPQDINADVHGQSTNNLPGAGHLVALRTKAEAQVTIEITHAYVVQVAQRSANTLLRAIDDALPPPTTTSVTLQHLRRFAKATALPRSARRCLGCPLGGDALPTDATATSSSLEAPSLYLLICATTTLSRERALEILASAPIGGMGSPFDIYTIPVPAQAPTSEEQALQWSRDCWPTVYKKHNPYGPHPSIVLRAEESLRPLVADWMKLARKVSRDGLGSSRGDCIGAVIVDPGVDERPMAVVAASDARWEMAVSRTQQGNGNIMAHAVMRAIGMMARKRRGLLGIGEEGSRDAFLDHPITPTEQTVFGRSTVKAGGYLCTELEIFVTHEPCVMCSMAILHSRFSKVIFGMRMPRTGGLTAESSPGLGYGLWWLPELNWKLLAWQWVDEESQQDTLPTTDVHA
ncbi:tRNA-specific adenosine deaminase subunit tad3 [Xylographa trunciseda]|nr:tRNA-specific adenosine deaminase subunit tad3 [Xylographa trunciseda]